MTVTMEQNLKVVSILQGWTLDELCDTYLHAGFDDKPLSDQTQHILMRIVEELVERLNLSDEVNSKTDELVVAGEFDGDWLAVMRQVLDAKLARMRIKSITILKMDA